jgi:hypothetical protein
VTQGLLKVTTIEERLAHVVGRFVDTSALPRRNPLREEVLRNTALRVLNGAARSVARSFDLERGRFIFRARGEVSGKATDALVDETTGELVGTEPAFAASYDPVFRNVLSRDYPQTPVAFWPGDTSSFFNLPVSCAGDGGLGLLPCSGNTCYYVLQRFGAVDVPVMRRPDGTPWIAEAPCSRTPFTYPVSTLEGQRQEIYRMLNKLRDMKVHWSSYLPAGQWSQLHVQLGDRGNFIEGDSTIYMNVFSVVNAFHEYGHYVHLGYSGFAGHPNVVEGWADTFYLYYAPYSRFVTREWPDAGYFMPNAADNRYHRQELVNGAYFPDPLAQGVSFDEMMWPRIPGCLLPDPDSVNKDIKYGCGWLMSVVYWELAWNECRTSFRTCSEAEKIVTSGTYAGAPWMLANSAFAYAVSTTVDSENLDAFMDRVSARYADFLAAGYLDQGSYQRVLSVMAHHRFGRAKDYSAYTLPGTRLPRRDLVTHANFKEAEDAAFVNPGSISVIKAENAASRDRYVAVSARGSKTGYSGELAFALNIPLYADNNYQFRIKYLAKTVGCIPGSSETFVDFKVDGSLRRASQRVPSNCSWQWAFTPAFALEPGHHTVSLLPYVDLGSLGDIHIDAVVVEKMCGKESCPNY